jgi:uncharacterized protein (TIRG00374 family)
MASDKFQNPFHGIRPSKIIFPIMIGLGVVAWMFWKDFDPDALRHFQLTSFGTALLITALACMLVRDLGYIIRIRILTDNKFTWLQAFRIIMLWEFTSAVTPSAVGGTSVAILFVNREGLSLGKSSAVVMATSFLDEMYFVLMFPILILAVHPQKLFQTGGTDTFQNEFFWVAVIGYSVKVVYLAVLSYGLFINPRGLKWLLLQIFRLPMLRRWRHAINDAGYDIINSSRELLRKPFRFWAKAFGATFLSWTARYWVVNALVAAFFWIPGFKEHFLIFARQLVMWIMQLISPTPGGSGFAEYIFTRYLGDLIPLDSPEGLAAIAISLAFLWRLISYYPYLFVGAVILPKWIRDKFMPASSSR